MAKRNGLLSSEEAVSPVIAVILMVAITVVLAATVYVWVSGFGAHGDDANSNMAIVSSSPLDSTTLPGDFLKRYVVSQASPGLRYRDIDLTLDGTELSFDSTCDPSGNGMWSACAGVTVRDGASRITGGDIVSIRTDTTPGGQALRVIDNRANAVIVTLWVG